MLDLLKAQLRFWEMESTKTSRDRRGAERMQPVGSKKGKETSLAKEIPEAVMATSSLSYCFKVGKEEKGGKMSSGEVKVGTDGAVDTPGFMAAAVAMGV